jgi:uncharacterized Zn finger protein
MEDVRAHLAGQSKDALVELLMSQAATDARLRDRLLLETVGGRSGDVDLATFRAAIDRAVEPDDYEDYRPALAYANDIEQVIARIQALLDDGHAEAVVELAEHAIEAVEQALGWIDDSDGYLGGVLERLGDLHHTACAQARPDPQELAERLFRRELGSDWETFFGAAATYADVLGPKGLAAYRRLAEAEWARVAPLRPGDAGGRSYEGKRFRVTEMMTTLAALAGDVDELIAVMSRDLSHAYDYVRIAEVCLQDGRHDQALGWAERGAAAFPQRTDPRLRQLLAEEYHRRGRHDEAMALAWAMFTDRPTLEGYWGLKAHADRIGGWPAWRDKALAHLRSQPADRGPDAGAGRRVWPGWSGGSSELVRIFLWEGDNETAWQEATQGGCSEALWMELAAKREADHPEDALPINQDQVERLTAQMGKQAYQQAVGLLRKVREVMTRLGREEVLAAYLASVRATHKRKRNLIKLLDAAGW